MRDSFIFYRSFYEALSSLSVRDRAILFDAICNYSLNEVEPELNQNRIKTVWLLIKPILVANNKKFENGKKGANYGKLGGRPKKTETPPKPQENPNQTPNKDKDKDKEGERIETFGSHSQIFITVKPKYITDKPCKVYQDGFRDYCNVHLLGTWFKKDYLADLFWKENTGKMFNEHSHVSNVILKYNNG